MDFALGYTSLFAYCRQRLHLSEHAALNRIEAARAGRAFPIIFDRLAEGALTLTAVRLLRPLPTREKRRSRTSICAVRPTTATKRSGTSVRA